MLMDLPDDSVRSVADMAEWVAARIDAPAVLVGHSFGAKVAMAVAALHPEKVGGIVVIAGSNRGRPLFRALRPAIKLAKRLGIQSTRFQSADYRDSSPIMKQVMQNTLDFDIVPMARRIKCPAVFIYGENDTVTKAKLGRKLSACVPGARFYRLSGFNHNTIITAGALQVSAIIKKELF